MIFSWTWGTLQEYDTLLLKTGDVTKYVQQSIRNGSEEWESLVNSIAA